MIVVDASVIATALGDDGDDGDRFRAALAGNDLAAPDLIDLEVASVWRRRSLAGSLPLRRAILALTDLRDLPMLRAPHAPLLSRCWELRENLTCYDAAYAALAEVLSVPLITADRRLARAPDLRCQVHVLS